jgi:hypothetical protein
VSGNWKSLSFDLGPITPLAEGLQSLTDTLATILTIVKTATDIVAQLAVNTLSTEALLIQAALQAIQDVLTQYIEGAAKVHFLVVPPRKALPPDAQALMALSPYENGLALDLRPEVVEQMDFQTKLNQVFDVAGGNADYGRTVAESLTDENDPNRPQYSDTDAYFAVAIVAGGTSLLELYDYAARLMAVFDGALKGRKLMPVVALRTPQDLRARVIAAPGTPRIGVRLNWSNLASEQILTGYGDGNVKIRIDEVAIIRSTDRRAFAAKTWDALMGSYQPTPLGDDEQQRLNVKTIKTADGTTQLLALLKFTGQPESYVDNDSTLAKGQDYYYAVAYRFSTLVPDNLGKYAHSEPQRYFQISSVVKAHVDAEKVPFSYGGVPPDWDATPSALNLFPDLKYFLALLRDYVQTLQSQAAGAASALASYVLFLQSEIDRYVAYAQAINERVAALTELMRLPQTGIYVTLISGASGGTSAFMSALTDRLSDQSDTTAPPYFRHGVTSGLVIFAGAPNPAALDSVQLLISLLLGLSSGPTAFEQAVDSIDQVLTAVEDRTFSNSMASVPADTTVGGAPNEVPPTSTPTATFSDGMEPTTPDSADANIPWDP